jgi:phage terminase Nu1 subunit (DNA packaging protein)
MKKPIAWTFAQILSRLPERLEDGYRELTQKHFENAVRPGTRQKPPSEPSERATK